MTITATLITPHLPNFRDAALYRLSETQHVKEFDWETGEEVDGTPYEYVVVSTVNTFDLITNAFNLVTATFIFPSDDSGKVINWEELEGSYQGGTDHHKALRDAGWEVK